MAVLETIRVKFGIVITVLIAVALLSFIIDPTTLQSVSSSMSSKYDVGEIDGKAISYVDFQADVDRFTAINEIVTGSSVQNEQTQLQIRNAAWQALVDKYLFIKNAKKAGLTVGEEEMIAILSGELDSPVFAQNPVFCDENGNYIGEGAPSMIMSKTQASELNKDFETAYRRAVITNIAGVDAYRRYLELEDEYNAVVKAIGWTPETEPSPKKYKQIVTIGGFDDATYRALFPLQKEVAFKAKKVENFVGTEDNYYELLEQMMESKQKLIDKYNEL